MSIFERLGGQMMPGQMGIMQNLQQIKENPVAMLQQRGLSIPAGMRDPQQIVQHLVQSGQVAGGRLQQIMQAVGMRV